MARGSVGDPSIQIEGVPDEAVAGQSLSGEVVVRLPHSITGKRVRVSSYWVARGSMDETDVVQLVVDQALSDEALEAGENRFPFEMPLPLAPLSYDREQGAKRVRVLWFLKADVQDEGEALRVRKSIHLRPAPVPARARGLGAYRSVEQLPSEIADLRDEADIAEVLSSMPTVEAQGQATQQAVEEIEANDRRQQRLGYLYFAFRIFLLVFALIFSGVAFASLLSPLWGGEMNPGDACGTLMMGTFLGLLPSALLVRELGLWRWAHRRVYGSGEIEFSDVPIIAALGESVHCRVRVKTRRRVESIRMEVRVVEAEQLYRVRRRKGGATKEWYWKRDFHAAKVTTQSAQELPSREELRAGASYLLEAEIPDHGPATFHRKNRVIYWEARAWLRFSKDDYVTEQVYLPVLPLRG